MTEKKIKVHSHYLWHLSAIGMFDALSKDKHVGVRHPDNSLNKEFNWFKAGSNMRSEIWGLDHTDHTLYKGDKYSTKIAIIDVGVYPDHPAFNQRIEHGLAIDFGVYPEGAYLEKCAPLLKKNDINSLIKELNLNEYKDRIEPLLTEEVKQMPSYNNRSIHTSHGTSAAGVIAGFQLIYEKKVSGKICPITSEMVIEDNHESDPLVYFGVDPTAKIIPITTSHAPDPRQLIRALLYAAHHADIIFFPQDIADPQPEELGIKSKNKVTALQRILSTNPTEINKFNFNQQLSQALAGKKAKVDATSANSEEELVDWELLRKIIKRIAEIRPFICAAGNSGMSTPIYPAHLANKSELISVGAVSYEGYRAGYSNYGGKSIGHKNYTGITVVAPSGDSEVMNEHQLRIDEDADWHDRTNWGKFIMNAPDKTKPQIINYSPQQVLAPDIPGKWGYTGKADDDEMFDDGELTDYSGTSAASAIAAGVISLLCRKNKIIEGENFKTSGSSAKEWLLSQGINNGSKNTAFDIDVTVGTERPLTPDVNNENDIEQTGDKSKWFGAGLISVATILADIKLHNKSLTPDK